MKYAELTDSHIGFGIFTVHFYYEV